MMAEWLVRRSQNGQIFKKNLKLKVRRVLLNKA